jgi:hypothetical protein
MKVSETRGGLAATLRLRSADAPFDIVLEPGAEIALVRSEDQTLLHDGRVVRAVAGAEPGDEARLLDVVVGGFPFVAYVARATPTELVVETRKFSRELPVPEPIQFGLDEKVMDDVRRGHRVGGTTADVARWLEDRLFLPAAPGGDADVRRMLTSGDPQGRLDAFRIHGLKVAADVQRVEGKLRIERVLRGGYQNDPQLTLLHASVQIVDATVVGALHGAARTVLSEAVAGKGSYLRTWQDYLALERASVERKARALGVLPYTRCELRPNGGWRFFLRSAEDIDARLASVVDGERVELEAGENAPAFDWEAAGEAKKRKPLEQRLSAPVSKVDPSGRYVDLAGPNEDEDQPKPPPSGVLYLSTGGDRARVKRRERAEAALRTGNCKMPQLGLLMEGRPASAGRRARISPEGPKLKPVIREVFGATGPTRRQLEAIEVAINTPDVCLIQGPPGTGKTKVITAIQRCLAVLADENLEPSHQVLVCAAQHDAVDNLVQRSEVFGLPAMKVGQRRRGSETTVDPVEVFVEERAQTLRERARVLPDAERLTKARHLVLACVRTRALPAEQAVRLRELLDVLDGLLPPALRDEAIERVNRLERPGRAGDPEEAEKRMAVARGIRVDAGTFSDDGPIKARVALLRLDAFLSPDERAFLERCAAVELGETPAGLEEALALRDGLVDRLSAPTRDEPRLDEDTQRLLVRILDEVTRRLATTRVGEDAVVADYLHELESDPEGVRQAIEHYTVVLAATLQHSASDAMRRTRGLDEGQPEFTSVIVDEAARAHPLDLFIPLSLATRRVVLVGDHRQLPHLLEPDVERQLAEGVRAGTVEQQTLDATKNSLFERLWVLLRRLGDTDRNPRTVTLDAQYRMHPELGAFVSREFYERHEDVAIESPRPAEHFGHDLPGYVETDAPCVAAWLDVPRDLGAEVRGASKSRPAEATIIAREVRRLIEHDSSLTFGVISFYSAQVDAIGRAMLAEGLTESTNDARGWRIADAWSTTLRGEGKRVERLRVGTVDAFQGKEFDVVFLSVTRSNDLPGRSDEERRRKFGHLMLENRLCVAMSRQQRLLIAVGDLDFVCASDAAESLKPLRAFADLCGGRHGVVRR